MTGLGDGLADALGESLSPEMRALELARTDASRQASLPRETLIEDIVTFVRRYISLTDEQALVFALWLVHTHAIAAAEFTPYMAIASPTKGCGKTTLGVKI